jgi:glycosyltransferase involved in cell wall biosynthesis
MSTVLRRIHIRNHRRGLSRSSLILAQPFGPYREALAQLGVQEWDKEVLVPGFPIPLDTDLFKQRERSSLPDWAEDVRKSGEFLVLLPSRLLSSATEARVATGAWKNQEVLLHALRAILDSRSLHKGTDVRLVLIDRIHSPDRSEIRRRIDYLGLASNVTWVTAPSQDGFTRHQMIDLYSSVDVVVDDFGRGWYGSVAVEALALGKPVVTYVDPFAMDLEYKSNPFLNSRTPSAVVEHLTNLLRDESYVRVVSGNGREWIERFHGLAAVAGNFQRTLDAVTR